MKSYGRGSAFLLKIGHEQVDQVAGLLDESDLWEIQRGFMDFSALNFVKMNFKALNDYHND